MRRGILHALAFLSFACGASISPADPPPGAAWAPIPELTDEFEGGTLDRTKWYDHNPTWLGREPAYFSPKNVTVADGCLSLTARAETLPGVPSRYHTFTTAAVKSKARALYGYYEVRAKPMAVRVASGFWFYAQDPNAENTTWWTEIDVFEICGRPPEDRTLFMTAHVQVTPKEGANHWKKGSRWYAPEPLAADYHVYALEWDKKELKWHIDGKVVYTLENTHWHQSLHMNFDAETQPTWFGLPEEENMPSVFSIDYVRSWRKIEPDH
ncbi:MAG: family 16 glycosylhydrolase [Kiritimatiellae bacterium]|nr:family 16 glycosylhydrolase [Kiritimatiellia bacterium]